MTKETLRQVPLFESLDDESASQLCELIDTIECPAGDPVFQAGEIGDAMYIIERGKVRISMRSADGEELILALLSGGDFFGEMALLDGKERSANATSIEPSRLAVLSRAHFLSFMANTPRVGLEMLTALTRRLRRTDELLHHLATRNVNEEEASQLTLADHAADKIAEFGGSWKFIISFLVFLTLWVAVNTVVLLNRAFDAYPFLLLSTALNMLAALQAPIIMMSQNRQAQKDRLRADLDYKVNLKNELALNQILQRLHIVERDCLRRSAENEQSLEKNGG